MKPGESKEVDIALQIHYKVTAAGVGHFQAVATCDFHGKKFEGKGSHPVGALTRNNPLIDSMATAFGQLLLEMQAEFEKHRMLPHGVMLKPEAEALHDALIDLFELPQTERRLLPGKANPDYADALRSHGALCDYGGDVPCTLPLGHDGPHERRTTDGVEDGDPTPEQGPFNRVGMLLTMGTRCRYGGNMPSACGLHQGHQGTHERLTVLKEKFAQLPVSGDLVEHDDDD